MSKIKFVLAVIAAIALIAIGTLPVQAKISPQIIPLESLRPGQVGLTFQTPTQEPLSHAYVSVILLRWNSPPTYQPDLLASGRANARGAFVATLNQAKVRKMMLETGGMTPDFNALAIAVDPSSHWAAPAFMVVPYGRPYVQTNVATRLPAKDEAIPASELAKVGVIGKPDSAQVETVPLGIQEDTIRRPNVFYAMSTPGSDVCYTYTHSGSTTHELAVQSIVSMYGGAYGPGGYLKEDYARSATFGPSCHPGDFHRLMDAEYVFHKYFYCTKGGCVVWWQAQKWRGQLYLRKKVWSPAKNRFAQTFTGPYSRTWGQYEEFGYSVCIIICVKSKAQWQTSTTMSWHKNDRTHCTQHRYIDGTNDTWNNAAIAYTVCAP